MVTNFAVNGYRMTAPKVDFYILASEQVEQRLIMAAKIAEKAVAKQHQVFILAENERQAHTLDDLLWTFNEQSFLPHALIDETDGAVPVLIGYDTALPQSPDVLINLSNAPAKNFNAYQRVIEIVLADDNSKAQCREHYRQYRQQGCQLSTHNL